MLKRTLLLIITAVFSMLVAADCAQTCQDKFDECMSVSHSESKEKVCGEILHQCKLECAM